MSCPDCDYLRAEREGIHMDSHATEAQAVAMTLAAPELCLLCLSLVPAPVPGVQLELI